MAPQSDLDQQFTQRRQQVKAQAETQRQAVEQAAGEAQQRIREQHSAVEAETEAALGEVRKTERQAKRRRELPKPPAVSSTAGKKQEIEKQRTEARGKISKAHKEVKEAKAKDIEAVNKAEAEVHAELAKAEAEFKANNVRLDTGEYVDMAEFNKMSAEAQAKLIELGIDKFDVWVKAEQIKFEAENIKLGTGEYINKDEYNQLSPQIQGKLNELGVEGYNSWLKAQQAELKRYESESGYDLAGYLRDKPGADTSNLLAIGFTQDDIDSAVGQNRELVAWESDLQASNPTLYQIYKVGGVDNYNAAVENLQSVADKYTVATPSAIIIGGRAVKVDREGFNLPQALVDKVPTATLLQLGITQSQINNVVEARKIMVQLDTPAYKSEDGYNLPKFLRDNPNLDTNKLVTVVGFDSDDIKAAVEYNSQPFSQETPGERYYNALQEVGFDLWKLESLRATSSPYSPALLKAEDEYLKRRLSLNASNPEFARNLLVLERARMIPPVKLGEPVLSLEAFTEAFVEVRDPQTKEAKALLERLASEEYTRLYGSGTALVSASTQIGSYLFSPTRALYPEVEIKDISPLEWAVGAAQIALLAIPVVGFSSSVAARGIITGIEVAAGTTFAVATGIQWADMSWAERGISLALTAAIFAPVGVRGTRALLGKRGSVVAQAESSLNKAWSSLDRVKLKYGPESSQYIKALRNVETAQAKLRTAIGNVAQGAGKSVKTAINLARDAGKATRNMDRALRKLHKTSVGSRTYAKVVANAQKTIEASRVADRRLIAQFNRVKSLSSRDLATIEKKSGMTGLKDAVVDVNKAQANLERTWVGIEKYEVGSQQYIRRLEAIAKAQARLNEALSNFGSKLKPRAVPSPAAGWEGVITKLEGKIKQLRAEINSLEKAAKKAIFEREITAMNRQLSELRQSLVSKEMQLVEFIKARDSGIPAPVVSKYLAKWETKPPTRDELRRVFEQFSRKPVEPIKPQPSAAKPKVMVATMERPVVVERQLKLIPELEKVTPKVEPKIEAPKVKGRGYEISVEYEPSYRERMFEKPDVREDTYVEVIGEPLSDAVVVVSGRTVAIPVTERAIKTNIADIVKEATKAAERARIAGKPQAQINAMVLNKVNSRVDAITEPLVKSQVKPQTKVMTKLATKPVPKVGVKVGVKTKPRIPLIIKLPDGSKHTLTKEELMGATGWKQGFIYKLIFPPYGENNITNTRKPIPGIPYFKGPQSAYRSIVRLGGNLPPTIARDMGIMDVRITTSKHGKPKLTFEPDVKQKTKVTGTRKRAKRTKSVPTLSMGR